MEHILLKAYIDSIVDALGQLSDLSYPAAGIGEERRTEHLDLLEWDVKFLWTDDVVNTPDPREMSVQTTVAIALGQTTLFRIGDSEWHYLTAGVIQAIAGDMVLRTSSV